MSLAMFNQHTVKEGNVHNKNAGDVRWNCTGSCLGSTSFDKTTKLGQMDSHGNLKTFQNISRSGVVNQLCWHPSDKSTLGLVGENKYVEIWDVRGNCTANKISTIGNNINASWSPNGNYLSLGNKSDNLAVLDIRMGRQLKKMKFSYEINEMAWSYNSDHLLITTGGQDMGAVDILRVDPSGDSAEFVPVTSIGAHTSNCYCLKIDSSYRRMAVGSADFLVSLWDLEDMICYNTISCMDSPIRCLSFSNTGDYIAVAAEGNNLVICETKSAEQVVSIDCKSALMALAWHPQHNLIAIAPDTDNSADDSPRYRNDRRQYVQLVSFETLRSK